MFEKYVRDYYREYLGISFHCTEFGFFSYSSVDVEGEKHFWVNEMYIDKEQSDITKFLELAREIFSLAREFSCTHVRFQMDNQWSNYEKKRRVAECLFGFECIGSDGNIDYFARSI